MKSTQFAIAESTPLPGDWPLVRAAHLPRECLALLAPLRDRQEIRVHEQGESCWLTWQDNQPQVISLLLPARGVTFLFPERGKWFRPGSRIPVSVVPPIGEGIRLLQVLHPQRFVPEVPACEQIVERIPLRLIRGGAPAEATALRCRIADLNAWSQNQTQFQIRSLFAACCGEMVLVLGSPPPTSVSGTRYYGNDVLLPLGFRSEPELPAAMLRLIFNTPADELLLLDEAGAESIPRENLQQLTRGGLRLAAAAISKSEQAHDRT